VSLSSLVSFSSFSLSRLQGIQSTSPLFSVSMRWLGPLRGRIEDGNPLGPRLFPLGRGRKPNGSTVFSSGSGTATQWVRRFFYWVAVFDPMGP